MTCIHFLNRSNTVPQYLNTKNEALHRFQYPSWFMNKISECFYHDLFGLKKIHTQHFDRSCLQVLGDQGARKKKQTPTWIQYFLKDFSLKRVKYNFSWGTNMSPCWGMFWVDDFPAFERLVGPMVPVAFCGDLNFSDHRRLKFSRFSEVEILKAWGSSVEIVWFIPSMEEIPKANHQLGCFWNPINNGINTPQPQLVSRISEHLALCYWTWRESRPFSLRGVYMPLMYLPIFYASKEPAAFFFGLEVAKRVGTKLWNVDMIYRVYSFLDKKCLKRDYNKRITRFNMWPRISDNSPHESMCNQTFKMAIPVAWKKTMCPSVVFSWSYTFLKFSTIFTRFSLRRVPFFLLKKKTSGNKKPLLSIGPNDSRIPGATRKTSRETFIQTKTTTWGDGMRWAVDSGDCHDWSSTVEGESDGWCTAPW